MTANQIEDAGEQLVRNRRNRVAGALSWDELQAMNPALRTRECVKAKVWPRPDFEALVRDGVPALAARVLKQVYDGVATRPLSESLEDMEAFVGAVEHVREAMSGWLTSNARHEFGALALAAMPSEGAPSRDAVRALHRHLIGVVWPELVGVAPELWWPRKSARLAQVRAMGGSRVIKRLQVDPSEVHQGDRRGLACRARGVAGPGDADPAHGWTCCFDRAQRWPRPPPRRSRHLRRADRRWQAQPPARLRAERRGGAGLPRRPEAVRRAGQRRPLPRPVRDRGRRDRRGARTGQAEGLGR
jgi:hypothetical protein